LSDYKTHIKITSYLAFFSTLSVVLISLIPIIFPALIFSSVNIYPTTLDPFETGQYAIPLVVSCVVIFVTGFAYYKKKLPLSIRKPIEFILNFETSSKVTLIVAIIMIGIYISLTVNEITLDEIEQWPDYRILEMGLDIWPSNDSDNIYVIEQNSRYVRMFLLDASENIFQNIKILPFVASILLVIATYFLTYFISQKKFAGLVSMFVLLQSYTFLEFDTIAVYENFWVLFYVLSLLVLHKKWPFSPALYVISFFTKAFIAPYFVATLFYIYRAKIEKRKKLFSIISYIASLIFISSIIFFGDTTYMEVLRIDSSEFVMGFTAFSNIMISDPLILFTILPLTVGLFLTSKRGIFEADSILVLLFCSLIFGPILAFLTDFYFILPYRFMPLIVFFSIGIGVFLSKKN